MIKRVTKERVKEAIVAAIKLPENRLEDGSFNWNFIDADAYTEVLGDVPSYKRDEEKFYQYFDEIVFEIPPELRPKATHKYGRFW